MIQKEQNMMKLVNYHLIYMGPGRVSKEKKEELFVKVYNHFNKTKKKKLKRSDIIKYMSELREKSQKAAVAATIGRVVKRVVSQESLSLAIGAGLMLMCLERTKRTED